MHFSGSELYKEARRLIPGGTQLLSKRPELLLPEQWPSYYSKAKGVETWGLDGTKYVDMSYCAIGACPLGFADPDVDAAVCSAIERGSAATLNCPEEVELAKLLCELHPWAAMVRYARGGGEAMAIAVRIARTKTRRDRVAFCGYHGWHDWYLAANLARDDALDGHLLPGLKPAGVPRGLLGTALPFHYNNLSELESIIAGCDGELAAIVMEPIRNAPPTPGFLEAVKANAAEIGAVLVFDEVSSGWRLCTGGAHLALGVSPDMAVFSKAMSNGYPMAAVIGTEQVMQAAQDTFISSTNWTERIGPTAAIATINKHRACDVARHLVDVGTRVQEGWSRAAARAELRIHVDGIPPLAHFSFDYTNGQAMKTLFTQILLEKGFLATTAFYGTYAHRQEHVESYLAAVAGAFAFIAHAAARNEVERHLKGPIAQVGFHRLV